MIKFWALVLLFLSFGILGAELIAPVVERLRRVQEKRAQKAAERMEDMFVRVKLENFILMYTLAPVVLAVVGYFLFHHLLAVLAGLVMGLVLPSIRIKARETKRRKDFRRQLIDSLMILSSSLKGGLSLIQALEVLVEEMPPPISQEFGMVLAENKIGISLEESFMHLKRRMPSPELEQLITAILLARETGGNLPVIFSRLVYTMRENDKINQAVNNLTLQGRIQGAIMSLLPIVFIIVVYSFNPHMFDDMIKTQTGRNLLVYAVFSQIIGMILIRKLSKIEF
ncbi:MAG: type II secretion system F family protein [Candidatus Omnitrophota bacterium]